MNQPDPTADRLVAEARRAVHESLILLSAWEGDRVRALIADLETAVESRAAMRAAAQSPADRAAEEQPAGPLLVSPPPDHAALREQIRRVCAEADGFSYENLEPHDYQTHADAVLALLPESGRAATLLDAAEAVAALREKTDVHVAVYPRYDARQKSALSDAEALLRRLAAEAPQPDTEARGGQWPCKCAHAADEHSVYGCTDNCGCEWMPRRKPDTEARQQPPASLRNRRAFVHNAITEALSAAGDWVPLSVRIAATRAALAEVDAWHAAEPASAVSQPAADGGEETRHTGGNAEDCPVCRQQIDKTVLYPWICQGAEAPPPPA
ncbi:hypothetical protein [Streptomyces griseoluteus]